MSQDLVPVTRAMTALYEKTREYGSRQIVLRGGTYSYGILILNRGLEPEIVNWMKRQMQEKDGG